MYNLTWIVNFKFLMISYFVSSLICCLASATDKRDDAGDDMDIEKMSGFENPQSLRDPVMVDGYLPMSEVFYTHLSPDEAAYFTKRGFEDESSMPGVLRFGKRAQSFVRFGRSFDKSAVIKKEMPGVLRELFGIRERTLRFGKRSNLDDVEMEKEKKDVPGILRFGKRDVDNMPGVLRFGKRDDIPGVLRFGKRDDIPGVLRFGKRDDIPGVLRFGKRDDIPGVLRFGKRDDIPGVLRFGKRSSDFESVGVLRFGKKSEMPGVLRFGK